MASHLPSEELNRHEPLFDCSVPVTVRSDGRDETTATFIIRVLTGNRITIGQRERLLHIEITDKEDHFFLYTLDVSEDEFHRLKHDQSLLVEFSEFPSNVIALLNTLIIFICIRARGSEGKASSLCRCFSNQLR